jgi:hypothetical protein
LPEQVHRLHTAKLAWEKVESEPREEEQPDSWRGFLASKSARFGKRPQVPRQPPGKVQVRESSKLAVVVSSWEEAGGVLVENPSFDFIADG